MQCDKRDVSCVFGSQKCYRANSFEIKRCRNVMMHSELGYKLLDAERSYLEKHIIWLLCRWRIYRDRADFKSAMVSLDELALLKSLGAMRDDVLAS